MSRSGAMADKGSLDRRGGAAGQGKSKRSIIDIHSHILPGLDDGAKSLDESLAMLRQAADAGTTDIVATPHANAQFAFEPERARQVFCELQERAAAESIGIRLHLGCDFHLSYDNLRRAGANPSKYTIDGGQYLMIELPELIPIHGMPDALKELTRMGVTPIITHPERNLTLQATPGGLAGWIAEGCLAQVTGQSLTGHFGVKAQRAAYAFIEAGQAHFVASDAHDAIRRTADLGPAYRQVAERYGKGEAELLFEANPGAVIRDGALPPRSKATRVSWWRKLISKTT